MYIYSSSLHKHYFFENYERTSLSMRHKVVKMFVFSISLLTTMLFFGCEKQEVDMTEQLIQSFSQEAPNYQLYYLGKEENLLDLKVNYAEDISDILFTNSDNQTFVVFNNLDNSMSFSIDELKQLKENIERCNYSFYYFGTNHLDMFHESGLLIHSEMDSSSLSFGYVKEGYRYINVMGTWDYTANELVKTNDLLFLILLVNEFKYQTSLNY